MKLCHLLLTLALGLALFAAPSTADFDDEDEMIQDEFEDADIADIDVVELNVPKVERPVYKAPVAEGNVFIADAFESEADYQKTWVESRAKKDEAEEDIAKYDGVWSVEETEDNPLIGDLYLVLKTKAKHHAVASKLKKPYEFSGKPFVMQYEVRFQSGQECGGAYVKLLSEDPNLNLKRFTDKTPYSIMFGPDKCGNDQKLHFIFRHQNPVTGLFEEKHAKKPTASIDSFFTDKRTHLYTLVILPDNTFEIYVDQNLVNSGSLLTDFTPAVNPDKEIVDPEDTKPADWDEREKIQDPDATKPEDWDENEPEKIEDADAVMPDGWLVDEPELLPDEDAEKPDDWDEDIDGEWEPPMISNPKCDDAPGCGEWTVPLVKNPKFKGKWRAPMVDNPEYKGKWKARIVPNPNYFEDTEPYKMTSIGAVGLELWSMSDNIAFDNFIVTDDKAVADKYAADSWQLKQSQELAAAGAGARSVVDAVMDATNERPWLWAVFVVVILLPVVLVVAYCCMPGSAPKKQDDIARMKKADESTPDVAKEAKKDDSDDDDDDSDDDEEEAEKTEEAAGDAKKTSPKATATKKKGKGELEADKTEDGDAEDESEDTPPDDKPQTRSSPRKRRSKRVD